MPDTTLKEANPDTSESPVRENWNPLLQMGLLAVQKKEALDLTPHHILFLKR